MDDIAENLAKMYETKRPEEPDWNTIIDEILKEMDDPEDVTPVGLDEYHFSQHSMNIRSIEAFDWPTEWIKDRPALLAWLEQEYEDWWENQLYDDDGFQSWLNGHLIRIRGDAYLDELQKKLITLYRERITETYKCSTCNKEISEKHPWGHPDRLLKTGYADPDVYPDGIPEGTSTDDIQWKHKLICEECWRKDFEQK